MNETIQTILNRRSIRAYESRQIDEHELQEILLAGEYAPTAMGQQPWHFTVLQNPDLIEKLQTLCKASFLNSDNASLREIATREDFQVFYNAPTLVIISGNSKAIAPLQDCVLSMANMLLAATSLGIGSCWVHSPMMVYGSADGAASLSNIGIDFPKGYEPYAAAVFGYSAQPLPKAGPRNSDTVTMIR
ncbi:MAG: nitroreductase family protein [Chlorobiales bacterium]|nr:nitroreductase family protein [Chlorobiales bacterium]